MGIHGLTSRCPLIFLIFFTEAAFALNGVPQIGLRGTQDGTQGDLSGPKIHPNKGGMRRISGLFLRWAKNRASGDPGDQGDPRRPRATMGPKGTSADPTIHPPKKGA